MVYYKNYDFSQIKEKLNGVYNSKYKHVVNNIFTADTETTTLYLIDGKWRPFNYDSPPSYYTDNKIESSAFVYVWQFGIEDVVYYGRCIESFKSFTDIVMKDLRKHYRQEDLEIYIYVHNLPYDMCFFNNVFDVEDSFQRKPHKQMYCKCTNGVTFRDSYIYSNLSLASISKNNTKYKKLSGEEFNYTRVRYPWTELSEKELAYCENDILALWEYLTREKESYKNRLTALPLTNTGKVRRGLQQTFIKNDISFIYKCQKLVPTLDRYKDLLQLFMGGVAHSNALYNGEILSDVKSKDYTSSYPFVMLSEKYPSSNFLPWRGDMKKILANNNIVWYATMDIYDFRCKNSFPYLPTYKAMASEQIKVDNGRAFMGKHIKMLVTNVDYQIIKENYKFSRLNLSNVFIAKCDYLPDTEREYILDLYVSKTRYKDDDNNIDLYMNSKNMFNSLYGCQVTQLVSPVVNFDNETKEFVIEEFNDDVMIEQLQKQQEDRKNCFSFAIGCWVTAYARHNLYECLNHMNRMHVIYCDTDSVKYIEDYNGQYDEFFKKLNAYHNEKLRKALPIELYHKCYPQDIYGKSHLIGVLDTEKGYEQFKTFGAKKYAVVQGGKIKITVSGLNKIKGAQKLNTLDDFKLGQIWDYKESGRTTAKYNNAQKPIEIDGRVIAYKCGVTLQPTTYKLSLSNEYESFILEECKGYVEFNKNGVFRNE